MTRWAEIKLTSLSDLNKLIIRLIKACTTAWSGWLNIFCKHGRACLQFPLRWLIPLKCIKARHGRLVMYLAWPLTIQNPITVNDTSRWRLIFHFFRSFIRNGNCKFRLFSFFVTFVVCIYTNFSVLCIFLQTASSVFQKPRYNEENSLYNEHVNGRRILEIISGNGPFSEMQCHYLGL